MEIRYTDINSVGGLVYFIMYFIYRPTGEGFYYQGKTWYFVNILILTESVIISVGENVADVWSIHTKLWFDKCIVLFSEPWQLHQNNACWSLGAKYTPLIASPSSLGKYKWLYNPGICFQRFQSFLGALLYIWQTNYCCTDAIRDNHRGAGRKSVLQTDNRQGIM